MDINNIVQRILDFILNLVFNKSRRMVAIGLEPDATDDTEFEVEEVDLISYSPVEKVIQVLQGIVISQGGIWQKDFNIIGFQETKNVGTWNDIFIVVYKDIVYKIKGTTDPGKYYTKKPLNVKGCAHMCRGFHKNIWKLGKHRGKYEALIQIGGRVKVWRDKNKDYLNNDGIVESGYFGINFHGAHGGNKIGRNSAGCQVVKTMQHLAFVVDLFKQSGLKATSYTLVSMHEYSFDIDKGAEKV